MVGSVWEGVGPGGTALLEEVCHRRAGFEMKRPPDLLVHSFSLVLVVLDLSSQVPAPFSMSATWCLPPSLSLWTLTLWTISQNKLIPLYVALVMEFYPSKGKLTIATNYWRLWTYKWDKAMMSQEGLVGGSVSKLTAKNKILAEEMNPTSRGLVFVVS